MNFVTEAIASGLLFLGELFLFGFEFTRKLPSLFKRPGLFLKQCEFIGVKSVLITVIAAVFMGGVIGYQLYSALKSFGGQALVGGSVGVSLLRELGPVMTAIMVTGQAGAAIAAEISSQRLSEQIDALEVMAVDPIEYLVVPRVVAGFFMVPALTLLFCLVGSYSGAWIACGVKGLDPTIFWSQYQKMLDPIDLLHCIVKSVFFGVVLTTMGCFYGYRAQGGARAVGFATRNTVVATCLTILLGDYLLTTVLPFGWGRLILK